MTTAPVDSEVRYDSSFADVITAATRTFGAIFNPASGEGTAQDKSTYSVPQTGQFLSRDQIRALLTNSWLAERIVTLAPEHCIRRGLELAFKDSEEIEGDVKAELEALGTLEVFKQAHCTARAFGGSAILLFVDDGKADASYPLELSSVRELTGFYVIEGGRDCNLRPAHTPPPWAGEQAKLTDWTYGPDFGKPVWWEWEPQSPHSTADAERKPESTLIHKDRLIFFPGRFTDRETKASLNGWDLGFLDAAFKAISGFESAQTSLVNIVYDFFTVVAKVKDYKKIVSSGEVGTLIARFKADAIARSILHMHLCDATDEDIIKLGSPVGGLDDVVDKIMDNVAGASGYPRSIFFNEAAQSGGKDSTGLEAFYDGISGMRQTIYAPGLRRVIDILREAERRPAAERPYAIGFRPLKEPSEKERAEAMRTLAHADEINIKDGIYSREEARQRYRGVGVLIDLKLDSDETPSIEEVLKLSGVAKPGFQREAGQNTEAQGKVPTSGSSKP